MIGNRLRIAIFTHNYPVTSKERKDAGIFLYDFAHELAKRADVFVFCPDFGGAKESYKIVPVTWFKWDNSNRKFGNWPIFSPLSVYKFFKLMWVGCKEADAFIRENNIDFCLAAWTIPSSLYTLYINKRHRIPYSVWILGSDLNIYAKLPILKQLMSYSLSQAKVRFSNSYWLIENVKRITGKDCRYMAAITNFDLEKVKPEKLPQGVFNFLFVARLEKVKGPDVLVKACIELRKIRNDFVLHILGDGTMRLELERMVKKFGIKNNVIFYGNADKEKIGSFMKAADSLVVASRAESLPLVMVEAARAGLPSIATDVGDCRRAIEGYKIGYVAESENPKSLSEIMARVMNEKEVFKKTRRAGLVRIVKDFSQEKTVKYFLTTT